MNGGEAAPAAAFADTNVWLYALLATQDAAKSAEARRLVRDTLLLVSTQLINEVCVNLIRKARFTESQIEELVGAFYTRHSVVTLDRATLLHASRLRARYQLSFWDSMMTASALAGAARVFYSEDMHHGLLIEDRLRVTNPFHPTQTPAT